MPKGNELRHVCCAMTAIPVMEWKVSLTITSQVTYKLFPSDIQADCSQAKMRERQDTHKTFIILFTTSSKKHFARRLQSMINCPAFAS